MMAVEHNPERLEMMTVEHNPERLGMASVSKSSIIQDLQRVEVILTVVAALIPQILAFFPTGVSHIGASEVSGSVVAIFTAFEAVKDGWNKTKS